jgi:hypothetical protein
MGISAVLHFTFHLSRFTVLENASAGNLDQAV